MKCILKIAVKKPEKYYYLVCLQCRLCMYKNMDLILQKSLVVLVVAVVLEANTIYLILFEKA